MSKLVRAFALGVAALVVLDAAGPAISRLIAALVPLVLVVGVVVVALQLVRYYTRR